jgi:RimJ/RimL family protein N-acetyltransferase
VPQPVLHTDRLRLEPLADVHLPHEVALDADAEVLRYLFPRARTPEETRARHILRLEEGRQVDGLGMWAGFGPEDAFVGLFMLTPPHELGYRIARAHWRQGYATEGARALLQHGFETVGLELINAETMAVNAGSRAVMAGLGMRYVRTFHAPYDEPVAGIEDGEVEYELTRRDWLS